MKNTDIFNTLHFSILQYGQIIADHTIVDKFDDIPQYYIDEVKEDVVILCGRIITVKV